MKERERKKERQTDMGTQALMEQRCFNDLSVSIYRLLYKKFDNDKDQKTKRTATVTRGTRD